MGIWPLFLPDWGFCSGEYFCPCSALIYDITLMIPSPSLPVVSLFRSVQRECVDIGYRRIPITSGSA